MQRLHHIFQRAVLALALLTSGLAGGYALHDPAAARAQPCRAAIGADRSPQQAYADLRAASGAQADCNCGSA